MITLVDSNVILDLVTDDPKWAQWSADALSQAANESTLAINPLIFAEVSIGFRTVEELEQLLPSQEFGRLELPYEAAADYYDFLDLILRSELSQSEVARLTSRSRNYNQFLRLLMAIEKAEALNTRVLID